MFATMLFSGWPTLTSTRLCQSRRTGRTRDLTDADDSHYEPERRRTEAVGKAQPQVAPAVQVRAEEFLQDASKMRTFLRIDI